MSEEYIDDITEEEYLKQVEEGMDDAWETFQAYRMMHDKIMYERTIYKLHFFRKTCVDEEGCECKSLEYHRLGRKD